ncbi:MAG: hypothetical protein DMF92_14550 [Acidobacteria bacterium]|nr:MAG: hypothetical protein DMF92_14550 [Acidobacteriota bacterium]
MSGPDMKNMSSRILRAVAIGHIAIGALLLPAVLAFGGIFAPILIVGPIWGIALGVRLWQSGASVFGALRRTHRTFLLASRRSSANRSNKGEQQSSL